MIVFCKARTAPQPYSLPLDAAVYPEQTKLWNRRCSAEAELLHSAQRIGTRARAISPLLNGEYEQAQQQHAANRMQAERDVTALLEPITREPVLQRQQGNGRDVQHSEQRIAAREPREHGLQHAQPLEYGHPMQVRAPERGVDQRGGAGEKNLQAAAGDEQQQDRQIDFAAEALDGHGVGSRLYTAPILSQAPRVHC